MLNFRLCQQQVSPVDQLTTSHSTLHCPASENDETEQSVIIQEHSNSNDSLLSFYTATHANLGTQDNPIDVDRLLDRPPSPPRIPIYLPPHMQSAPVTIPCMMCR